VEATTARAPTAERARERSRRRAAPLIAYFDTSALIKLLVEEEGSEVADELWSRATWRVGSRLVYPEARAALAMARRTGRIEERSHRGAVRDLDAACAAMRLIGIDWQLAVTAGDLAERYALRGYDAVHLATALSIRDAAFVLATWDGDLGRAAVRAGCSVIPRLA
jgi:predicted nucleic acid-binding protein